jgi:hypothetical protein
MDPEIIFKTTDEELDIVPARVTRVISKDDFIAVEFKGRGDDGLLYEGILRLACIAEEQEFRGRYRQQIDNEEWTEVPFSVKGRFYDSSTFEGRWSEQNGPCEMGVYGLPPIAIKPNREKGPAKAKRRRASALRAGKKSNRGKRRLPVRAKKRK